MMQYYRMVTLICSWILCAVEDLGATFHALLISVSYAAFCAAVLSKILITQPVMLSLFDVIALFA